MSCLMLLTVCVVASEGATKPAWLQWRFSPGQILYYRQIEEQTIGNDQGATQRISDTDWKLHVREVSHERAVIALRIERIRWRVRGGKETLEFDTQSEPQPGEPQDLSSLREAVGRDTVLVVDPHGVSVAPTSADATPSLASVQASRFLGLMSSWMPRQAVEPGQGWSRQEKLATPIMNLVRMNTLTVRSPMGDRWIVDSQIELKADVAKGERAEIRGDVVMECPGSAQIVFDAKRGLLESLTSKVAFDMNVVSLEKGRGKSPSAVRQSLTSEAKISLLPAEELLGN